MKHKKIKAGVVQATPALFDIEKTIEIILYWLDKAVKEKCELLLFPESFIPCYPRGLSFDAVIGKRSMKSRDNWLEYWENSLDVNSTHFELLRAAIKKAGIFVGLGVTERESVGGSLFCTLLYFAPDGTLMGKHRKIKPTGLERYIWAESDGSTLMSFDTKIGKIGGLICWENYMPLARQAMYHQGVDIYLAPTADSRLSWQSTMQHIALEGRCFVLSANQFVKKSDYPYHYQQELNDEPEIICAGGSAIISPMGEVLAGPIFNCEGLLTAELDFSVLARSKLDFDVIGHYSRNDIFKYEAVNQPDQKKIWGIY